MPIDETEYTYPVLTIKQLHAWGPPTEIRYYPRPIVPSHYYFWGPYWWYGY